MTGDVEVARSHAMYVSQPAAVDELIENAASEVGSAALAAPKGL